MTVTPCLDNQNNPTTRLSLLVYKAKPALEQTKESSSDGKSSSDGESSSDGKSSSDGESSSDDESSSDGESNSAVPDRSSQDDPEEHIELRRPNKRPRTSTAIANPQRQSRDSTALSDSDSDRNRQDDANGGRSHAEYRSTSLKRYPGDHEVLARGTSGGGMAGSLPRAYAASFNAEEGGGKQLSILEFNGRGQPLIYREPMWSINDPNSMYEFVQRFSDDSKREICVVTRMAAQESIDTLIVYENIYGPGNMGLCIKGRVLR